MRKVIFINLFYLYKYLDKFVKIFIVVLFVYVKNGDKMFINVVIMKLNIVDINDGMLRSFLKKNKVEFNVVK